MAPTATLPPTSFHPAFAVSACREDVVAAYPELEPVCDQLGIAAHRPLSACRCLPEQALLELAREALPPPPDASIAAGTAAGWQGRGLSDLVRDIVATHHRVARNELARLGILLNHQWRTHPDQQHEAIDHACEILVCGVLAHLDHEEKTLFPLCLMVAAEHAHPLPRHHRRIASASDFLSTAHVEAAAYLAAIGAHLRHLPAAGDADLLRIGRCLAGMAADLTVHQHKEEDVLIPAVMALAAR